MPLPDLDDTLTARFGDAAPADRALADTQTLRRIAARGSCRRFTPDPVAPQVLHTLAAVALAAPSKSDLQQRDVVIVTDATALAALKALMPGQDWIAAAPAIVVFCADNHRQRLMHQTWDRPFANDHLDAFFNATLDAGIALATFVVAAEAAGLGCCPISVIRNRAAEVSALLDLPDHVFPVAGLGVGHPAPGATHISARLPLGATVHANRFDAAGQTAAIAEYDARRHGIEAAYRTRTGADPDAPHPTWSDGKTKMYENVQRADFGAFVRAKGFNLD